MTIKTAYSTNPDPNRAAQELLDGVGKLDLRLVVFFASAAYAPDELGQALAQAFGQVPSIGCTTAAFSSLPTMSGVSLGIMSTSDVLCPACLVSRDCSQPPCRSK